MEEDVKTQVCLRLFALGCFLRPSFFLARKQTRPPVCFDCALEVSDPERFFMEKVSKR